MSKIVKISSIAVIIFVNNTKMGNILLGLRLEDMTNIRISSKDGKRTFVIKELSSLTDEGSFLGFGLGF